MTNFETNYAHMPLLTPQEIEEGRNKKPAKDYPSIDHRLKIPAVAWETMLQNGRIIIPEGLHSINDHPHRNQPDKAHLMHPIATEDNPMGEEWAAYWHQLGLLTDTADRPLHPRAAQLLTHPDVGMFTGPGYHYRYGPQRMGNLALRRLRDTVIEYAMVAVNRDGGEKWSVPGGYLQEEDNESVDQTAFREGWEEANIIPHFLGRYVIRRVLSPPRGFKRDTLHGWGEEWFTFPISYDNPGMDGVELSAKNDTKEVRRVAWVNRDVIANPPTDFDIISTHQRIILEHEALLAAQGYA